MTVNVNYYHHTVQLLRGIEDVMHKQNYSLAENDHSKIIESMTFVERLFPKVVLFLCPAVHRQLEYISDTCQDILGISKEYLKAESVGGFIKLIHPDDIRGFSQCVEYMVSKKIDLCDDYRILVYYRLKTSSDEYVYVEEERIAIRNDAGRFVHLSMVKNITHEESFSGTRLKILKRVRDKYLLIHEYAPKTEGNELTSRQRDIIQLVLMGLSNQEIADRLSLSIYTIKNHKQALFKKFGIGTSLELTSLVKGVNRNNLTELFSGSFVATNS